MNRHNDPKAIHETHLKDVFDLFDTIRNWSKDEFERSKGPLSGMSSIAKASSNLTLVFPVICSRGISIEHASMISKAVEKNCVTMLQRLFAAHQVADDSDFQNYLNQFHRNLSTRSASLDDIFYAVDNADKFFESASVKHEYEKAVAYDVKNNLNYYLPSAVNEGSLNDFVITEDSKAKKKNGNNNNQNGNNATKQSYSKDVDQEPDDTKNGTAGDAAAKKLVKLKDINDGAKSAAEYFGKQVLDNDFKKANELMPTSMAVNFRVLDNNNNVSENITAMIGVKAKLYPIGSEDIVKHISDKTSDNNWITNFFRATTREISFMKDLVLAIDKAKIDALSLSTRQSTSDKMWKVLERRATISRLKKAMRQNNNVGAITTLCVSQEEVDVLRKEHNIDLERVSTVLGLFESYNFMCICIVDESLEVAKFIFDENEPMWETISFNHLERESSDNTYKRVVNLMTKMH